MKTSRRQFLATTAAIPFTVGSWRDTFVIHRALGEAIDLEGQSWFWHQFVLSDEARRIGETIMRSAPAIKEHADCLCELLAWKCWHGTESPDAHLRRLIAFASRTGFETQYCDQHHVLVAHSDDELRLIEAATPDRSEETRKWLEAFRREHRRACRERRLMRERRKLIQDLKEGGET